MEKYWISGFMKNPREGNFFSFQCAFTIQTRFSPILKYAYKNDSFIQIACLKQIKIRQIIHSVKRVKQYKTKMCYSSLLSFVFHWNQHFIVKWNNKIIEEKIHKIHDMSISMCSQKNTKNFILFPSKQYQFIKNEKTKMGSKRKKRRITKHRLAKLRTQAYHSPQSRL